MNKFKRCLALLLVLIMVVSMVPLDTSATGRNTTEDSTYNILHLDCGRKYFTKNWIIALLNEMSAAGFTHLELAFGNDGMRFLLDDMEVIANGTTFSDEEVTAAVQAGNKAYYDAGEKNELTETEMNAIISHAQTKGIEIIPLLNNPGHMNTVVSTINTLYNTSVGYDGSASTIDLENENAVAFTKAFVQKYINYFKEKGCKLFNMGADEYANDIHSAGSMGFGELCSDGKYNLFVQYVNDVADMILGANMTPMAFNDGIYFQNYNATYSEDFNKNIMICFWSSGWSGYQSETATELDARGHKMINANGDFYYVLGKNDQFDSNGYTYAGNFSETQFMGSEVANPVGSMFCIWSDYPGAETETQIAANARLIIRAMGLRMQGQSIENMDTETVVEGGFAADGTISENGVSMNAVTDTENATDVFVTGPNLTHLTAEVKNDVTVDVENVRNIKAWDVKPYADTEAYTGEATVKLPVSSDWNTANMGAFVVNDDGSTDLIKGKYSNGYYEYTVPHFSVTGIYDVVVTAEITETVDVTLAVGETKTLTDTSGTHATDSTNIAPNSQIATMEVNDVAGSANATVSDTAITQIEAGTYMIRFRDTTASLTTNVSYSNAWNTPNLSMEYTTDPSDTTIWTLESSGDGYKIKSKSGKYLAIGTYDSNNAANLVDEGEIFTFTWKNGAWTIRNQYGEYLDNLGSYNTNAGGWREDGSTWELYKVTESSADSTEISYTGVSIGTTTAIVGNVQYNITVEASPLVIEYWITNGRVKESSTSPVFQKTVSTTDAGVNTEAGVEVSSLVPATGYRDRDVEYWRSRVLDRTTNEQTEANGDDETDSGVGFTKVRYWNNKWQVYTTAWTDVDLSNDQLVAYYMEIVNINNSEGESEIKINSADWGIKGDGKHNWGYNPEDARASLSLQIVYEGGSTNPAVADMTNMNEAEIAAMAEKTFLYYYYSGRDIGTFIFESEDYQIYKIAAVHGNMESTEYAGNTVEVNSLVWATNDGELNEQVVWEDDATNSVTLKGNSNSALTWGESNNAILLRIYVKTVAAEDNLHVHYIDDIFDNEFYVQDISVKEGTTFKKNLAMDPDVANTLINNDVVNYYGASQYVNADLKGMSEIGAQYRYSNYQLVSVNFGTNVDNTLNYKEVYLHYTFSPVRYFVADFGLPLNINPKDLDDNLNNSNVSSIEISSGKTRFGSISVSGNTLTYTPTKVLTSVDAFTLLVHTSEADTIEGGGDGQVAFRVYVVPATTVFYEEGFVDAWSGSWTNKGNKGTGTQELQLAGAAGLNYGYSGTYKSNATESSGTEAVSIIGGDKAEFTFTGTGVDIYANCDPNTSTAAVLVYNADTNALEKFYQVATKTKAGTSSSTDGQAVESYSLPIVSVMDLSYGNHKVVIQHTKAASDTEKPIQLDGFRVYNTLTTEQQYITDGNTETAVYAEDEQTPMFIELRDEVLTAKNVDTSQSIYTTAGEIINQVYNESSNLNGALVLSGNAAVDAKDLLDNGPKNELFLQQGDVVTFNLGSTNAQIGMKAINGAANYEINHAGISAAKSGTVSASTDMFYEEGVTGAVTIKNTSGGILSITKLKVFGVTAQYSDFEFEPLNESQVTFALSRMVVADESAEPEVTYADALLNVNVVDANENVLAATSLTHNGVVGGSATFTAASIEEAVTSTLPEGYELTDVSYENTEVAYGEEATVSFTAEEKVEEEKDVVETIAKNIFSAINNLFKKIFSWW